ncbi:MAG: CRISPR-associated endonuclease Cas2 [Saprospiraceae bacterium]|nr:CRISPR-associated endonuclease Cas2 [Saprospiraceae bacterium]
MIAWVIYDIESDKARTKVAKFCKQAGLYRVQLSVFLGTLSRNDKDALALKIEQEINVDRDKVYIFPMSKEEMQQVVLLGQAFDQKLVTDQVRAMFF